MAYQKAKSGGAGRAGFTLVELLVVIGIIAVLAAVLLPMTMRARRSAAKIKMRNTLQTLSTGLEAYQQAWKAYPSVDNTDTFGQPDHSGTTPATRYPLYIDCGAHALFSGLICRWAPRNGGEVYGPFVNVDALKIDRTNFWIVDDYDKPILYFPAPDPKPNIRTKIGPTSSIPGYVWTGAVVNGTSVSPMYDYRAMAQAVNTPGKTTFNNNPLKRNDMQLLLGDANNDGMITGSESPATTQPYLLWMAGFDGVFGFASGTTKTDDVANFDFPPQYVR